MQRQPRRRQSTPSDLEVDFSVLRSRTDDKAHAASLIFSAMLLLALATLAVIHVARDSSTDDALIEWLCSTFLIVVGAAIGRSGIQR